MRVAVAGALATVLTLLATAARADTIELSLRLVDGKGAPKVSTPVRVVVDGERDPRGPTAGATLVADADGRVARVVEAPVGRRWVPGAYYLPKRVDSIAVGVELELVGHLALYWITVDDHGRDGALLGIEAFVQGRGGAFDAALVYVAPASWRFPDAPGGPLLTDIGAAVRGGSMESSAGPDGKRRWRVAVEMEKREFARR